MKEYKVKRYGRDRRHQKTAATLKTVLMVLLIAGACAAGWFLYDPISAWLTEKAEEHQQRQEQQRQEEQNQNQPGNPENPGTTDEPTAEQTALPESCAVLDTAVLYDMAALENRLSALAAKGYTGAVFTLKDEDGLVLYQSALEDVTGNTAQTAQRYDLPAVIAKIKAAGLTPVGRLWAFDDHTAGRKLTDATVKYNYTETNWIHNDKEAGGHTWLNPMSERAQGYILSLLGEAADNGLEVLILEGVQFPTGYSLNLATYAEKGVTVDKSKVLADFTAKAAAAMKARNVSLWTALWLGDLSGESVRLGGSPLTVMASAENCLIKAAPEQFATRKAPLEESIYTVMHPWWSSLSKKLRARFDEQNNIDWSKQLEEAGCTILYGFDDYKVHSKLTLITKKSPQGYSYITQIGTGNYNEKTSELYTDYSFITADLGIGEEASNVFQNLAVQKLTETTEKMLVAPLRFKSVLLDEMDRVINAAKLGRPASMILKNNSISDRDIILKLEEASCAGVRIDMIVRGICCVRAEVPGKTENLHIRSLVGRYLEHGRIYSFYDGVTTRIYIASGDFLTRNTECRVEVGVRVEDPVLIQKLSDILQLQLRDNVNAREMRADGSYQKVKAAPGEPLVNGQMDMYDLLRDDWLARDTASAAEPEQPEIKAPERLSEPETRPEPVQVAEQPAEPTKQPATVKAAPAPAVQSAPAPHDVDRAERHGHPSLFQRLHDWLRR